MWEIESNSVGIGSDQGAVRPGQPINVGSPHTHRGVDRTNACASTKPKKTGTLRRLEGGVRMGTQGNRPAALTRRSRRECLVNVDRSAGA